MKTSLSRAIARLMKCQKCGLQNGGARNYEACKDKANCPYCPTCGRRPYETLGEEYARVVPCPFKPCPNKEAKQ